MKRIIMFVLLFAALKVAGQTTGYFRFDTVRIMKQNGTCELYLINKTKDSLGLLTNVGGGLTSFKRPRRITDSSFTVGNDTLILPGRHWNLQGVLNNGSSLTENEVITLSDSLTFTDGMVIIDTLNLPSLPASTDTTANKPIAVDASGNVVKMGSWPNAASGNFIVGSIAPTTEGINGDYYLNQLKSQLYKKNSGVWDSIGYIFNDTVVPLRTDALIGPMVDHLTKWDTAGFKFNTIGIARNQNHGGNGLLTYKDDPVMVRGWNVNYSGGKIQSYKPALFESWESNFDTRQFGRPGFEWHWINHFIPGSGATAYSSGERLMSAYVAHGEYDAYLYWTFPEMYWQWRESPGAALNRYMTATPGGLDILRTLNLDSVYTGNDWLTIDNIPYGTRENSLNLARLFFKRSGFLDTATLRINTGGDFVFQTNLGSGRTLFNLPIGVGLGTNGTVGGFSGKASFQADQTGNLFSHKYDVTNGTFSFNVSEHNSIYGIGLNTSANRQAYLDITNMAGRLNFINYFTSDINVLDSAGNAIKFNFERKYNGSFTSANLASGRGYEFNLNTVSRFGTMFTANQASNSEYTSDFVWRSMYSTTMLERMRLSDTGYLYVKSLDTDNTPPATTGTIRNVIVDANGLLSSSAQAGITSINAHTGPAITVQGGTAISVDNTVSNTATLNVTPSSSALPHTLDAVYTTAGNTGTTETDLYSYSVPANKLAVDGRTVNFEIDGEFNDNTATATVKLYFAGNVTLNTGAVNISTALTAWRIKGYIIRTSSTTAHVTYEMHCPGLATAVFVGYNNLTSLDFTTTNIFKVTAQAGGAGGGNDDITAHSWQLLYKPQPQ